MASELIVGQVRMVVDSLHFVGSEAGGRGWLPVDSTEIPADSLIEIMSEPSMRFRGGVLMDFTILKLGSALPEIVSRDAWFEDWRAASSPEDIENKTLLWTGLNVVEMELGDIRRLCGPMVVEEFSGGEVGQFTLPQNSIVEIVGVDVERLEEPDYLILTILNVKFPIYEFDSIGRRVGGVKVSVRRSDLLKTSMTV